VVSQFFNKRYYGKSYHKKNELHVPQYFFPIVWVEMMLLGFYIATSLIAGFSAFLQLRRENPRAISVQHKLALLFVISMILCPVGFLLFQLLLHSSFDAVGQISLCWVLFLSFVAIWCMTKQ
jgi:hypothetical protein